MYRLARFKTWPLAILLVTFLFVLTIEASAQNLPNQTQLHFYFAFGAQTVVEGVQKLVPVETKTALKSGDLIKFFLQSDTEIYFYFFHLGSQGNLTLLSPINNQSPKLNPGVQVYIPEGGMWLELDDRTGQEKFFLIASSTRLEKLEKLYERHTNLEDKSANQASVAAILSEISKLDQRDKRLSAPAEKPISLAGRLRDPNKKDTTIIPDIGSLSVELIANGIYSKTFTIDHR
jgi:hypothetical protein